MSSIEKVWTSFDQQNGQVGLKDFQKIMVKVANDQNLLEGGDAQTKQNAMFFTGDNLGSIFEQILNSQDEGDDEIPHTTVVDILYNVLN